MVSRLCAYRPSTRESMEDLKRLSQLVKARLVDKKAQLICKLLTNPKKRVEYKVC